MNTFNILASFAFLITMVVFIVPIYELKTKVEILQDRVVFIEKTVAETVEEQVELIELMVEILHLQKQSIKSGEDREIGEKIDE